MAHYVIILVYLTQRAVILWSVHFSKATSILDKLNLFSNYIFIVPICRKKIVLW